MLFQPTHLITAAVVLLMTIEPIQSIARGHCRKVALSNSTIIDADIDQCTDSFCTANSTVQAIWQSYLNARDTCEGTSGPCLQITASPMNEQSADGPPQWDKCKCEVTILLHRVLKGSVNKTCTNEMIGDRLRQNKVLLTIVENDGNDRSVRCQVQPGKCNCKTEGHVGECIKD